MSVQRIDRPQSHTHGWQARAYVRRGHRLTRFFADAAHGGYWAAQERAERAQRKLAGLARKLQREQLR